MLGAAAEKDVQQKNANAEDSANSNGDVERREITVLVLREERISHVLIRIVINHRHCL